ncbi:hypothetical protein GOBAR_AA11889 [Gossypium barbadense]|uniref:Uncharacterized protein n=1 Tax=Gossypium barbadense TaxID=3634 RepID=A0A2P5XZJ3_GOSBA|nr:hypothetical protein GOBAR_AA11889 [Gossypium barbadense]
MSQCSIEVLPPQQQRNDVVVGYAFTSKKVKSFLRPKLQGLARNKGISFVPIDQSRSLSDQGPFDIVLHKMTGREWRQILEEKLVFRGNWSLKETLSIPDFVAEAGLRLPLVAKPFVNDGSEKSHELSLAYAQYSLQKLEPPLVLQMMQIWTLVWLGLRLFNLDIIREHGTRDHFYVLDINYFPGKWVWENAWELEQHKMIQVTLGDHGGKMLKRWQNVATPKQTSDDGKIVQIQSSDEI